MARRKADASRGITVEEAAERERPVWNDTLRGILVALVKDRRPLWDARFRTTKERTIQLFREIAAILSNQDSRMNEWYVLEKWCWMMEMFSRATERSTFEWRFKGAMAFHLESMLNGIQYIDSLSSTMLQDATARYAETVAEVIEAKSELNSKLKKGNGVYRAEMAICNRASPPIPELTTERQKLGVKRGRTRGGALAAALSQHKQQVISAKKESSEKAPTEKDQTSQKTAGVKQEVPECNASADLTSSIDKSAGLDREPSLASLLSRAAKNDVDDNNEKLRAQQALKWSFELVSELIQNFKEQPALWHNGHPHFHNTAKRNEYLAEIAKHLRKLPGGGAADEESVVEKWSMLCESFNEEMKKVKEGGSSNWEYYQRLLFLSPEVMAACSFVEMNADNQAALTSQPNDVTVDVEAQIHKILGYVPEAILPKEVEENPAKRPKLAHKAAWPKKSSPKDTATHVQQVVSTWVPPREDALDSVSVFQSMSTTPPVATAQVTAKNDIAHMLGQSSPRLSLNGSKFADFVSDQPLRTYEDKWTLMGRMIEETARELDAKHSELAFRLQKDISDLIFKYQLEGLKYK